MESETNIVKKGRSREEKERLLAQWKESGKTRKQFCEEQGINYGTFATWPRETTQVKTAAFKEIKLDRTDNIPFAHIYFPNGIRIELFQSVSSEYLRSLK